jgi:transglutaminase-like putative cysteine protease
MVRKTVRVLVVCTLAVLAFVAGTAIASVPGALPAWAERTVRFNFTVTNQRGTTAGVERLLVYVPATTSNQRVTAIDANLPYEAREDALGNRMLAFSFNELAPYGKRRLTITVQVEVAESPDLSGKDRNGAFEIAEPMVERDSPEILALVDSFGTTSETDYVRNVYRWVREHIAYAGYIADDLGATSALKSRRGDCSEFAYLVAALNRARGIPTKVLGGYVVTSNAVLRASEYHNWNEAYVDGQWRLVDAQKGVFFAPSADYVATRVISRMNAPEGDAFVHRYTNPEGGLHVEME